MQMTLFPVLEEEIGEITGKMKKFLWFVEVIRPSYYYVANALRWYSLGRPIKDGEKISPCVLHEVDLQLPDDEGAD